MKVGLPLMKNVIKPLAKGAIILLELTAAAAAAAAAANVGIPKSLSAREPQHRSFQIKKGKISRKYLNLLKIFEKTGNEANNKKWISWYFIRYIRCNVIRK